MLVIDSSCWLELMTNGQKAGACEKLVEKATPENCVCPSIVIYEVYKKLKQQEGIEGADYGVASVMKRARIVDLDAKIAVDAADLSLQHKLAAADAIVKATANAFGATLVTLDHHFKGLQDVQLL